jgi:hypothetical protein
LEEQTQAKIGVQLVRSEFGDNSFPRGTTLNFTILNQTEKLG